jgi:hypothetical protein
MKIAIPTYDQLNIVNNLVKANGFLVFTVQFGEIMEEEFRPIRNNDPLTNQDVWNAPLDDCSLVIFSELNEQNEKLLLKQKKQIVYTNETIITKIILEFLNTSLLKESNTLCCP